MTHAQTNILFPKPKQYLVIDWSNFVYRAFFTVNNLKTMESLNNLERRDIKLKNFANVFELLMKMVASQLKRGSDGTLIVGEGDGKKRRQQLFPPYKANRSGSAALPAIQAVYEASLEMMSVTRCTVVVAPDGEADDAIATLVKRLDRDARIRICSEDRDLWQLIRGDRIVVHSSKMGLVNEGRCLSELGVPPRHVACLKAYGGDTSDNIPRGVPHMRTAHVETVAALDAHPWRAYEKAAKRELLSKAVLKRVVKYKEQIRTNFKVVTLLSNEKLHRRQPPKNRALRDYIEEWGLDVEPETVRLLLTGNSTS